MRDNHWTQLRRNTIAAFNAVTAMGGMFFDANGVDYAEGRSFPDHVRDWTNGGKVCRTLADAVAAGAYFVDVDQIPGKRSYTWRLCSYKQGTHGGHSYHGEEFTDADDFWSAMRTVEDLATRLGKAAQ